MGRKPGLRPADVARACQVSTASVADWQSGKTKSLRPGPARLAADLFGCDQNWIGSGVGSPNWQDDSPAAEPPRTSSLSTLTARGISSQQALTALSMTLAQVPRDERQYLATQLSLWVLQGGPADMLPPILRMLEPEVQSTQGLSKQAK